MSNFENPFESSGYVPNDKRLYSSPQQASGLAIASLVTGILALIAALPGCCCTPLFLLSGVLGLVAVVTRFFGLQECNRGEKTGKGMAIAGLVCGGIAIVLSVLLTILTLIGVMAQIAVNGANRDF
jgi:hypothetical protein